MIKVGDIITAYHTGYHVVTSIERRFATNTDVARFPEVYKNVGDEYSPLVYYKRIMRHDFTVPEKTEKNACDMAYCKKVDDEYIDNLTKQYEENLNKLKHLIAQQS